MPVRSADDSSIEAAPASDPGRHRQHDHERRGDRGRDDPHSRDRQDDDGTGDADRRRAAAEKQEGVDVDGHGAASQR